MPIILFKFKVTTQVGTKGQSGKGTKKEVKQQIGKTTLCLCASAPMNLSYKLSWLGLDQYLKKAVRSPFTEAGSLSSLTFAALMLVAFSGASHPAIP